MKSEDLKKVDIFYHLSEVECAEIFIKMKEKTYTKGTNIIIEGEVSAGLYFIESGLVSIFKSPVKKDPPLQVGSLRENQSFGEMSLIESTPRTATIRADLQTKVHFLSKESFDDYLKGNPLFAERFFRNVCQILIRRIKKIDSEYVQAQYDLWRYAIKKGSAA